MNYLLIRLKNKLFGLKNIMISILLVLLVVSLTYTYFITQKEVIYDVGIVDNDKSITSNLFIEDLESHKEINLFVFEDEIEAFKELKSGKLDIIYEINLGFENKLKKGDYNDVLSYNKESTMKITSWLNDYIALKVIKNYVYFDIYKLINENTQADYDLNEYREIYIKNYEDNSIIKLNIVNLEKDEYVVDDSKRIFVFIIGTIILYISMSFGKEIINEKNRNIIKRLDVSDISIVKYIFIKFLVLLIYLIIPIIISYLILSNINVLDIDGLVIDLIKFTIFIFIDYFVVLLFIVLFKEKNKYMIFMQAYILVSMLISSNIFKGTFEFFNKVSLFFPLSVLIDKF
ncbi:ABC transporter permease [Clostridiaceae bacterium HSG29]|nr:ABC transporter permease [Clostridiaceae bacterium HSG29]